MNYRIRRGDNDFENAALDELRGRRRRGELSGSELVRGDDDRDWQPLDQVLNRNEGAVPPLMATGAPRKPAKWMKPLLFATGAVIVLAAAAFFLLRALRPGSPIPDDGLAAASRPLPVGKTPTEKDVEARFSKFDLRQWLDGYDKRGAHGPTPDPVIEKFIRAHIEKADIESTEPETPYLATESARLAHDPSCTDPLVLTLAAANTLNWYDRVDIYKRAVALFPSSGHLAYPAFYADVSLMNESKYNYDQEGELNTAALALLSQCFADGSFQPRDQQEIAAVFIDYWGYAFFSRNDAAVCDIVSQAGPAYRWLALVMDGERCIIDAWNARGDGTIDTVTDAQLAEFKRLLAEGGKRLTAAWTLHPDYPVGPSLMAYDCLGGTGLDAMRMWFDRAIAAQIDYPAAWKNMRWGLRPRWYGSRPAELALGRLALNTGRFDTDVPRKFFDCVLDVESWSDLPAGQRIFGQPDIWPDLQRMYEGYVAEPSQAHDRNGWRSSYAAVAYLSGHYDVTRKQLEALDWKLVPAALTSWGVDLTPMPLEVAARTGPLGEGVAEAEATRIAGDRAGALRMYTELDSKHTTDDRSREFIRLRLLRLTFEQHLAEGEWVSLMPASDHDPDWVYSFGDAHRNADGSLDVEYGPKGHMLYPKVLPGANFEVRGRFEVIRSSNTNFQAGIVIGWPDIGTFNWYGFRMKRHDREGDVVTFGLGWSLREMAQHFALNDKSNSFDLVLNEGRVTATVNDEKVFDRADAPAWINVAPESYFVGLGAFSDSDDAVVRYEGVELRRLKPAKEADASDGEFGPPTPEPTSAVPKTLSVPDQIAAETEEMNQAIDRVKQIVNQPAFSVPIKEGMNITWWSDTWFHPGATVPNYAKVDVSKTQKFPYSKYEYVASSLHPDTAFLGSDLEFNDMTKLFYVDRSVPKRRLTRTEMAEINGLYRVIGRCEADLRRLGAK